MAFLFPVCAILRSINFRCTDFNTDLAGVCRLRARAPKTLSSLLNLVEIALATQQLALLATRIALCGICRNQNFEIRLSIFGKKFLPFPFSPFLFFLIQ